MVATTASTSTTITGQAATEAWAIVPSAAPSTVDTTAASAAAKLIKMARRSSLAKALIQETVAAPIAAFASGVSAHQPLTGAIGATRERALASCIRRDHHRICMADCQ